MSADSLPISPQRFAAALPSLPTASLHAKAAELLNSLSHLHTSNTQLLPFADPAAESFDAVCAESIQENLAVMTRMRERLDLLKEEVEGRGGRWVWGRLADEEAEIAASGGNGTGDRAADGSAGLEVNGLTGRGDAGDARVNGNDDDDNEEEERGIDRPPDATGAANQVNGVEDARTLDAHVTLRDQSLQSQHRSGRFTDEELARWLEQRMREEDGGDNDDDDNDNDNQGAGGGGLYL